MSAVARSSHSGRRLNASGRARRAKRIAAKRRQMLLSAGGAVAIIIGAPLSIASYMGLDSALPGVESAKSFFAMMADRSPGNRTKAELTKTKRVAAAGPKQRALGKIAKPAPPTEFVEAIAPPLPKVIEDIPVALAPMAALGPILITPQPPGGGVIIPPQAPPPGGGGPTPPGGGGPTPPGGGGPNPPPPGEDTPLPPPPLIPEPGTWATMLLGFTLTGWMMRRRRRKVAAFNPV